LAYWHFGKHAVDQMGGGVSHAPAAAGWTESPPFTRKSDHPIMTTRCATDSNKAVTEKATIQEAAELSVDKCGYASNCCLGLGEEGLKVVLDHSVKKCVLGCTALILEGLDPSRDLGSGAGCDWVWASNSHAMQGMRAAFSTGSQPQ
jgi:hypothetical protein